MQPIFEGIPHGFEPAVKKVAPTAKRSNERRNKYKAACFQRCCWPSDQLLYDRQPNQRLYRGRSTVEGHSKGRRAISRQGCDTDWGKDTLEDKEHAPATGAEIRQKDRQIQLARYKRPNRSEVMFRRLKDWHTSQCAMIEAPSSPSRLLLSQHLSCFGYESQP